MAGKVKVLLFTVVAGAAGFAVMGGRGGERQPLPRTNRSQISNEERMLMNPASVSQNGPSAWSNPSLSFYERTFCRGNRNAANCDHRPLHPFTDHFDYAGMSNRQAQAIYFHVDPERSTKLEGDRFEVQGKEIGTEIADGE